MIAGLITPDEGHITLDKISLTKKGIAERSKEGISYLPQESSIFRKLSVEENILSSLELRNKLSHRQITKELDLILEEFGLSNLKILSIIFISVLALSLIVSLFFYNFSAQLKFSYLDIKNKWSAKIDHSLN